MYGGVCHGTSAVRHRDKIVTTFCSSADFELKLGRKGLCLKQACRNLGVLFRRIDDGYRQLSWIMYTRDLVHEPSERLTSVFASCEETAT